MGIDMDDILCMAREAGLCTWIKPPEDVNERFERFAKLIAMAEREACAKVCDSAAERALSLQKGLADDLTNVMLRHHAAAHKNDAETIRARGEQC